ncbi:hypothetical protein HYH02_012969 [Chlamydomonas schloesseri]|uniref:Uncharacterized protein n=1 Tax=Chlamydomonas schloesseri TaxID=2026947 RepID=A0A835SSM0_9CHLO|nr:hypothetical protein HYH02_012969 [Chlamydomonas schloesseri]|eukprot:KAG2432398.1 hypothetical protein HYH02_012969 [Chlamydomonas schloesseri]
MLKTATDLPRGSALATELEAAASKLRQKEQEAAALKHEVQAERQMRAQLQVALSGAQATIRQLRAAPTPPPRAPGSGPSFGRRRSEPGSESGSKGSHAHSRDGAGTAHSTASSGRSLSLARGMGGGARGVRDSVCRQLLQSPASTLSTLSFAAKPTLAGGCSPLSQPDAACSPKELPPDGHVLLPHPHPPPHQALGLHLAESSPKVPLAQGGSAGPVTSQLLGAQQQQQQQSLSGWMLTALATPGADGSAAHTATAAPGTTLGRTTAATLAELQTPAPVGVGQGVAAAVRAALAATPAQPLTYGSPLHLRIQRLLLEAHDGGLAAAASPLGAVGAGAAAVAGVAGDVGGLEGRPLDSAQVQASASAASSSSSSGSASMESSACATPSGGRTQVDMAALANFRSSVSPFNCTLRERYALRSGATHLPSDAPTPPPPAASSRHSNCTHPQRAPHHEQQQQQQEREQLAPGAPDGSEVAELVTQLGLNLDLNAVDGMSQLDVLDEIDRWLSAQYIAAKKAILASAEPLTVEEQEEEALRAYAVDAERAEACEAAAEEGLGAALATAAALSGRPVTTVMEAGIQTEPLPADGATGAADRTAAAAAAASRTAAVAAVAATCRDAAVGTPAASPLRSVGVASRAGSASKKPRAAISRAAGSAAHGDDDDVMSPAADQAKRSPARALKQAGTSTPQPTAAASPAAAALRQPREGPTEAWTRWDQSSTDASSTPARRGLFRDAASARAAAVAEAEQAAAAGTGFSQAHTHPHHPLSKQKSDPSLRSSVVASGAAIADSILRGGAAAASMAAAAAANNEPDEAGSAPAPPRGARRHVDPFEGPSSSPAAYGRPAADARSLLAAAHRHPSQQPPARPSAGSLQFDDALEAHLRQKQLTIRTQVVPVAGTGAPVPGGVGFGPAVPVVLAAAPTVLPAPVLAAARAPLQPAGGPPAHARRQAPQASISHGLPHTAAHASYGPGPAAAAGAEVTQVLFTPGMAAGSGTKARPTGRTASRLTPEAAHPGVATTLRFGGDADADAPTESGAGSDSDRGGGTGGASPMRPLSSISSVSIVTSEAAAPTYSGGTARGRGGGSGGGWGSRSKQAAAAAAGREQEATSRPRGWVAGGGGGAGGSKPLFSFLASLTSCTRGSDAY